MANWRWNLGTPQTPKPFFSLQHLKAGPLLINPPWPPMLPAA